MGKDPTIDTSFLPDKGRDEFLEQQRRRLQIEWLQQQEEIKEAPFSIDYCFYDGTSHKKNMVIKRGYSIKEFLTVAKKQFPDIQDASTDLLLFVKENIILPHHYTFYELIEAKGNGQQTSCLDNWCQPESSSNPSPTTPILSSRSSALAHTAKIVEKNFYDRNKHLHPFNLWEVFTEKTSTLK
uniref:FAM50A/XAP5 C-terminal domain-containing protein n=1 Tax=Arcella intermedia TaxID=1963864 RepID=A0A6B2LJM4_9EUKA